MGTATPPVPAGALSGRPGALDGPPAPTCADLIRIGLDGPMR
ncbi:hypothetical protein [Micromonospora matsumotoense]